MRVGAGVDVVVPGLVMAVVVVRMVVIVGRGLLMRVIVGVVVRRGLACPWS